MGGSRLHPIVILRAEAQLYLPGRLAQQVPLKRDYGGVIGQHRDCPASAHRAGDGEIARPFDHDALHGRIGGFGGKIPDICHNADAARLTIGTKGHARALRHLEALGQDLVEIK